MIFNWGWEKWGLSCSSLKLLLNICRGAQFTFFSVLISHWGSRQSLFFPLIWKCTHWSWRWRTCQPREPTALGGSLRLKVGEQNSSGLCFHFLPPHFCLKFCFSSGVLFPVSHSCQCLGKSLSISKSKINEAAVQACHAAKIYEEVKCINLKTQVRFGRWVLYALPINNSDW